MHDPFFDEPVIIETARPGGFRTFASVSEAAIFMMERWPTSHGSRYQAALRACTGQLSTPEEVEMARQAFLAAAEEAGMLVLQPQTPARGVPSKPTRLVSGQDAKRKNRARMEEEDEFLIRFLARETGIPETQARDLINMIGDDRSSLLREARMLKARH